MYFVSVVLKCHLNFIPFWTNVRCLVLDSLNRSSHGYVQKQINIDDKNLFIQVANDKIYPKIKVS